MVAEDDPLWVRFWRCYPRRVGKKDARKAWMEMAPTATDVALMEAALAWQSQQPSWLEDGGQYVPFPASYLRAERWTDEPPMRVAPPVRAEWTCLHLERCSHRAMCESKRLLGTAKYPVRVSA
jgi:hypothetical protein